MPVTEKFVEPVITLSGEFLVLPLRDTMKTLSCAKRPKWPRSIRFAPATLTKAFSKSSSSGGAPFGLLDFFFLADVAVFFFGLPR